MPAAVESERRHGDGSHAARPRQAARHEAAGEEDDPELLGERPRESERAHEGPHTEDVLAAEKERPLTHRHPPRGPPRVAADHAGSLAAALSPADASAGAICLVCEVFLPS